MATAKKPAAKKPSTAPKPESKARELTRDEQRLLATYERRMALKRLQGMA